MKLKRALLGLVGSILVLLGVAGGAVAAPSVKLVSSGNINEYNDTGFVLADGSGVLFNTKVQHDPADDDGATQQEDVYLFKNGTYTWVTNVQADIGLELLGASDDGSKVFVETTGQLDFTGDTDTSDQDVYMISGGVATLISTSATDVPGANDGAGFEGNTPDGSTVYFTHETALTPGEDDADGIDVYARTTGPSPTTTLISTSANDPKDDNAEMAFCGASDNGLVVAFETASQMTTGANTLPNDSDSDTYRRSAGVTTLASTGDNESAGALLGSTECRGVSDDGTAVVFESFARLTNDGDDTSNRRDVFTYDGNLTTRISKSALDLATDEHASYGDISPDGDTVYFNAADQLTSSDTNTATDGYMRAPNGGVTLLTGNETFSDFFYGGTLRAVSDDGNVVLFQTNGIFAAGDDDEQNQDLYARFGGNETFQVSSGPNDPDTPSHQGRPLFENEINRDWTMSRDGMTIGFYTQAPLVVEDTDFPDNSDVYVFDNRPTTSTPPTPAPAVDPPPTVTSVKFSNKTFAIDKKIAALTAAAKPKKGTKISFTLSEAASVKLAFQSKSKGRTSGTKCVKETSKNRSAKKCTLLKTVATAKLSGVAGANSKKFGGRVGKKTLAVGSYQLVISATDAGGNSATAKAVPFTIVK